MEAEVVGEKEHRGFAPVRKAEGFFPLRCERKLRLWLAAVLARRGCH
jgi:hypothetical protein